MTGSFSGEKKKGVECEGQSAVERGQPRASQSVMSWQESWMCTGVVVGGGEGLW